MTESTALAPVPETSIEVSDRQPMSPARVQAHFDGIMGLIKNNMKEGQDFGTIPGCKKPSLWKPGAEKICFMLRIGDGDPLVQDLSTSDMVKFQVSIPLIAPDGVVKYGVGLCSSGETKYMWRKPIGGEYDDTPADRRREAWLNGRKGPWKAKQVRTNHEDQGNTILKMAAKRAYVDAALKASGTSAIFTQDIEDIPEFDRAAERNRETQEHFSGGGSSAPPAEPPPTPRAPSAPGAVNDKMVKRIFKIAKGSGFDKEGGRAVVEGFGYTEASEVSFDHYDQVCAVFMVPFPTFSEATARGWHPAQIASFVTPYIVEVQKGQYKIKEIDETKMEDVRAVLHSDAPVMGDSVK